MRLLPLIPVGLLLAATIAITAPSVADQDLFIVASPAGLTVTVATDNDNYLKGGVIQVSGTVKDSSNIPVASGTVTIKFSYEDWSQKSTVQITNGSYSENYYISYGNPAGAWTITASATDNLGDTGTASKSVTVTSPDNAYAAVFTSPDNRISYSRGRTLTISATIDDVENADNVFVNSPAGEIIYLSEVASRTYTADYTIKFDDPAENWSLSVEAKKTTDNTVMAEGTYTNILVVPAILTVNMQEPTQTKIYVGESVEIRAEILYPSGGGPVENATVSVNDPVGGSLTLTHQGSGVYSATYPPQAAGPWNMLVQAADNYGNSGNKDWLVIITTHPVPGFLEQYWWAILTVVLVAAFAFIYTGREKRLAAKLTDVQREIKEIPRLKKEAAIKYFKDGTISRGAYDGLVKRYDARMDELRRQEAALKAKTGKKKK